MLAAFNINWDIMSWGFSVPIYYVKPTTQLCQEAASILMLGGGYQVYNIQKAKGTLLNDWIVPSLTETAKFCRDRKFCHNSKSIAEVGVLYSKEAAYYKKDTIFGSGGNYNIDMRDLTSALLDNQLSVQVILSSAKNLKRFSMIVLPDCGDIEKSIKNRLLQYVKGGGTVILTGTRTLELFKNELLIKNIKTVTSKPSILIRGGNSRNIVNKNYSIVEGNFNILSVFNVLDIEHPIDTQYQTQIAGHEVENQQEERQIIGKEYPSVIESNIGKGKLIAITFDYGLAYGSERSSELKNLLKDITKTIPKKLNVKSSSYLEVDLQTNNDKTYIQLLNAGGEHRASLVKAFDEIPPLYHIEVEYKCKKQPKFVRLLPENINLPFTYSNKTLKTFVEKIEIHSAIEITF